MLKRICDICGRTITDDIVKVEDPKILMSKLNPYSITITCPRDWDWDLCPSCKEKLYSWVQEQRAAAKESFEAEDKEWGTMEERCNKEVAEDLTRLSSSINEPLNTIQRIRDRIREAKKRLREM